MARRMLIFMVALHVAQAKTDEGPQSSADAHGPKQPNIIFMMMDNFGFGDLGSYGGGVIRGVPTPRLDELAQEGLRLTNYNVEPECTPSRSALMTGRMPIRSGTSAVDLLASAGGNDGLVPCEYTIAQLLSDAGYSTALLGKWHLGSPQERLPNARGFDEWFGIPRSSDEAFWNIDPEYVQSASSLGLSTSYIWIGRSGSNSTTVMPFTRDSRARLDGNLTDKAISYIKAHSRSGKPFFLYIPFTQAHGPIYPNPDFATRHRTQFQNVLAEIDFNAGRIVDAVDSSGIANDTILVWTSDNGPGTYQGPGVDYGAQSDTGPFRSEFPSAWEGAIRVPCIIRWPGHTIPGSVSNELVSILDFYRTFANVAGASHLVPRNRAIDSIDQTDFFFGEKTTSNRDSVIWYLDGQMMAVKWKHFKFHFQTFDTARGTVAEPGQGTVTGVSHKPARPMVFDVESDPKELWNVFIGHTWIMQELAPILQAYSKSIATFPNIKPAATRCPWEGTTIEV